jgi:anthranilate synthase component II
MSEYGWLLELENAPRASTPVLKNNRFQHEHVLLIDHHDSFTQMIKSYFEQLGVWVTVVQHTDTALNHLEAFKPTRLVLSPGPGSPEEACITQAIIQKYYKHYPMLGICLGHQCLIEAFGGRVTQAEEIHHGKQSIIHHDGEGLFTGLPNIFLVTRYHSLIIEEHDVPHDWKITAWTYDEVGCRMVMGVAHRDYPLFGVQYHPEAVLTEQGMQVLRNFLCFPRIYHLNGGVNKIFGVSSN